MKNLITTHVLDTSIGKPAEGIVVVLETLSGDGSWRNLGSGRTNVDGRIHELVPPEKSLSEGTYRLKFDTEEYFRKKGVQSFYPQVLIVFEISDSKSHYHVPLLLSPFGYSTYRGS